MGKYHYSDLAKIICRQLDKKDPDYLDAYQHTLEFFVIYDAIEGTDHVQLIQCCFGAGKNRRKTINGIAMDEFCSARTLYRYITKYVICFFFLLDLPDDQRPDL